MHTNKPVNTQLELREPLAHDLHLTIVLGELGLECSQLPDLRQYWIVSIPRTWTHAELKVCEFLYPFIVRTICTSMNYPNTYVKNMYPVNNIYVKNILICTKNFHNDLDISQAL